MALTNYWWLIIWIFVGGFILQQVFRPRQEYVNGQLENRWGMLPAVLLALPYVVWAGFRPNGFGDTYVYRSTFWNAPSSLGGITEYLTTNTKDQGFSVLTILMKTVIKNSDVAFFLLIAIFQMGCLVYIYRKYSRDYWMSMFLFVVSTDYLSWMHNGIRQFIAVTLIFACFGWIVKKKYVPLIVAILLASTIHGSALMMIPLVFVAQGRAWNKKTIFVSAGLGVSILFIDRFMPVLNELLADTQYSDMMTNEIWTSDDGTNIIRVLVYSVPTIMAFVGRKYVDRANDPVINICVNFSAMTMMLYLLASVSSGIYVGRLPIYTSLSGYILMPWLIEHMFTEKSQKLVKIIMIGAYLVFFFFQMRFIWGLL